MNGPKHWEIYLSRERASGQTPWAIVEHGASKITAEYASTIVIKTNSYTGFASKTDRPMFVVHCFGILRRSGTVVYIEV